MSAPSRTLADVIDRLASPVAPSWSALTGTPVLAVDATGCGTSAPPEQCARVASRLATLPCPSVVLTDAAMPPAGGTLFAAFDVLVTSPRDLDAVVEAVVAHPLAAAALVHVLRAGAGLGLEDALVVESLAYATLQAGPEHGAWLRGRGSSVRTDEDSHPIVRVVRTDGHLMVTLDRPDRHNAFSARMRDELCAALEIAAADPSLTVVLGGTGPSFSSGGDLDEFGTCPDPATAHLLRVTRSPARLLGMLGPRVRAEVHGACIGAGIELAALAGHVAATPDAFIQLPEIGMGLIPGAGGTASLPRRIGRQRTAWLALTGRRLDAATARAWGLIDAIGDAGSFS